MRDRKETHFDFNVNLNHLSWAEELAAEPVPAEPAPVSPCSGP